MRKILSWILPKRKREKVHKEEEREAQVFREQLRQLQEKGLPISLVTI